LSYDIPVISTKPLKSKPDFSNLLFGKYFSDHMFVMDYSDGKWHSARIESYAPINMEPSTMVLHYGQAVFEGLKAYRSLSNEILLFRPTANIARLNTSNERMCIPQIDEQLALEGLKKLLQVDNAWIPDLPGTSLYIRPFVIATDNCIGVSPASTYKFMIITCPVGPYYKEGFNPVKIYVEPEYVRAIRGGVGYIKTIGNYAASLRAQYEANKKGYSQVLWLDGINRKYIEEVGTMNVFFKIGDKIITPPLAGSILPGVTRDSVIKLLKSWNLNVLEQNISIDEVFEAHASGDLKETFGTGTAAVISPIGELNWNGNIAIVNKGQVGELCVKLFDEITGIQTGKKIDTMNWIMKIPL